MIRDFIDRHFYHLYLITLFFGLILYGLSGLQATDEICAGVLFLFFLFHMFRTKTWEINKFFLTVLGIFIFYLAYSLYIHTTSPKGVLTDFIIQIKPYLAFFCVYQLMPRFSDSQKRLLKQSCVVCWALLVPLGIVGFFNTRILDMLMGHASNYAAAMTALSLVFLYTSENTLKNRLLFIVMLAIGLASGRSKFYGFFIFASFATLYFDNIKRLKINFKTIFLLLAITAVIVFVAKEKIELYFLQGLSPDAEKDFVARFALYATSVQVFQDYFPFGSGFGSFATYASGAYYSPIYAEYEIDWIWGISKSYYSFISDTYYPSLAQFGVVGAGLFILFWIYLLKKVWDYVKITSDTQLSNIVLLVVVFFAIENIADATFTSNRGFYFMMFLGIIYADMKRKISAAATPPLNEAEQAQTPCISTQPIENQTIPHD